LAIGQAVELARTETSQDGKFTLGVFVVNLDHAANEEFLFFGCASFPVVWLGNSHGKAFFPSPLFALRLFVVLGIQVHIILDG
jgi:hypothetical protein